MVRATRELLPGYELPTKTVVIRKFRFGTEESGGTWPAELWHDSIHSDDYAQKFGLKGGIAEGAIVFEMALLETIIDFFGESFFTSGLVEGKFTAPVYVGDRVTGKAKVREKVVDDSGTRIVLDVQVEKEDGSVAITGTVSALVP